MTKQTYMKNLIICLFLLSPLFASMPSPAKAEMIEIEKNVEKFGDWKVYCETDIMMDVSHCKIASKFFDDSSVITLEPTAKFFNQIFIVIPQARNGSFVKIRIDQNDLILSDNIKAKNFGLVRLDDTKKNYLYSQMKEGDFLFFRFKVRSSDKEVTTKMNLKNFRKALDYYNSRVFRSK